MKIIGLAKSTMADDFCQHGYAPKMGKGPRISSQDVGLQRLGELNKKLTEKSLFWQGQFFTLKGVFVGNPGSIWAENSPKKISF